MTDQKRRGSLVGPIILIGLGLVFLLNNLGLLAWSVWEVLLRLWPVLLIALGLDLLIGRRSVWGSLLVVILVAVVVVGALWLSGARLQTGEAWTGEHIQQPLGDVHGARVVISQGVGVQRIGYLRIESVSLMEGRVQPIRGETIARHYSEEDGKATLEVRSRGAAWFAPAAGLTGPVWDLGFNAGIPLELDLSLGAGEAALDLRALHLDALKVDVGVGQTRVFLPREGNFRASMHTAIGETVIVIPEGLAVRLTLDTGLASRTVPAAFQRDGNVYTSPGYQSAENRAELEVDLAMGQLRVQAGD